MLDDIILNRTDLGNNYHVVGSTEKFVTLYRLKIHRLDLND